MEKRESVDAGVSECAGLGGLVKHWHWCGFHGVLWLGGARNGDLYVGVLGCVSERMVAPLRMSILDGATFALMLGLTLITVPTRYGLHAMVHNIEKLAHHGDAMLKVAVKSRNMRA